MTKPPTRRKKAIPKKTQLRIEELENYARALKKPLNRAEVAAFKRVAAILNESFPGSKWDWVAGCSNPEGAKARCGSCSCRVALVDLSLFPDGLKRFEDVARFDGD